MTGTFVGNFPEGRVGARLGGLEDVLQVILPLPVSVAFTKLPAQAAPRARTAP